MPKPSRTQVERMRRAIDALPEPIRTIYRLHLLDGLDYLAIAGQLELTAAEVEHCIADAIVFIDRDLRRQERGGPR